MYDDEDTKMKVIYPYRKNASRELEWSIKSLKNVKHSGVYVIGEEPDFPIDAEVMWHLPGEYSSTPYHDQNVKYLLGCTVDDDELLLMNDDFFIMKPWIPENFNKGILSEQIATRKRDAYTTALINTEKFLINRGMSTFNFELHTPMIVEREKLQIALDELMPRIRGSAPVLIRSYYGNRWGLKTARVDDVKNIPDYKGKTLLSTNDKTFMGEMGRYIRSVLVE
jgi:hypothetical protein